MSYFAAGALALNIYSTNEQREAADDREREEERYNQQKAIDLEKAGKVAKRAAAFKSEQLESKAREELAIGSMQAADQARQGEFIKSRAKAIGAASGAGGYQDVLSDIDAESEFRTLTALFNSEQSARDLELAAEVSRREGADAASAYEASARSAMTRPVISNRAAELQGYSSILNAGQSLYEQFGRD